MPQHSAVRVTLTTSTGAHLTGTLTNGQSKTLAIICYGYKSTPDHPAIKIVARDLNAHGLATFVFRLTATTPVDIKSHVNDVQAIAEHFAPRFDRIVVLSSSLGALSASIAAARSPQINFLVTLNGFFGLRNLSHQYRRDFLLFRLLAIVPGVYRRAWRFYKHNFQPRAIRARTLVLHNPADTEVHIAQSRYFYQALRTQKEFKEIPLTDHDLSTPQDAHTIASTIITWLDSARA